MPVATQGSKFAKSTGDEPGVVGGIMSASTAMEAEFLSFSQTVCMEGVPVCRLSDQMTMNHLNTSSPGEMQSPLPPATAVPMPAPEEPKVCKFQKLTVRCGHDSRTHVVDVERDPGSVLQVITSQKPEKLRIDFESECALHGSSCAKLHVVGPDSKELEVAADHTVELPLSRNPFRAKDDWIGVLRSVLGHQFLPDLYTVYATTCRGVPDQHFATGEFVTVEVFPNASFVADLEFGFKQEVQKPDHLLQQHRVLEDQGKWEVKGTVKAQVGRLDLSPSYTLSGAPAGGDASGARRALFSAAQASLTRMCQLFSWIQNFYGKKFEIKFPNFKLGCDLSLAEASDKRSVRCEGKVYVKADKLFGASFTVDLLDWLLTALATALSGGGAPAVLAVLNKIRAVKSKARGDKVASDPESKSMMSGSADVGIYLTVGGDIGGGVGLKWAGGEVEVDPDNASIEAGLEIKLEALAKAEGKVCILKSYACFEASTGASLAIQSADGKSPSRASGKVFPKPYKFVGSPPDVVPSFGIDGAIEWNGLAIYYLLYADTSVKGDFASKSKPDDEDDARGTAKALNPGAAKATEKGKTKPELTAHEEVEKESKELTVLFPSWRWPEVPAAAETKKKPASRDAFSSL